MADDHDALLTRADAWLWGRTEGTNHDLVSDLAAALRDLQAAGDTLRRVREIAKEIREHQRRDRRREAIALAQALIDLLVDGSGDG